jgi:aldehyde:ferredoxin oxidoreductase
VTAKEEMEKQAVELYGRKDAAIPVSYKDKALSVWDMQNRHCVTDLLGVCKYFIPWGPTVSLSTPAKLFSSATGVETTEDELLTAAQRVRTLERAFDVIRGFRRKDDALPKKLFQVPVSYGPFQGEVLDKERFDEMLTEYYVLSGYDADGVPKEETFKKFGLSAEWETFKKRLSEDDGTQKRLEEAKKGKRCIKTRSPSGRGDI